jgi:hypothetical protein
MLKNVLKKSIKTVKETNQNKREGEIFINNPTKKTSE